MPGHQHRSRAAGVAIAALFGLFTVAACSSSPSGSSSGTTGGAAAVSAQASTAAPASAGVDVCSLLPAATVSSLTKRAYTGGAEDKLAPGVDSCSYAATEGYNMSATVYQISKAFTLDTLVRDLGGPQSVTTVSGVGDKAFASKVGLAAQFGNRLIEVGSPAVAGPPDERNAGYVAVAKALIAAIH